MRELLQMALDALEDAIGLHVRWDDDHAETITALRSALAAPAPADPWKAAIDDELVCLHIGTTDSFPDAKAALKNLIDWHVSVALDPAVSSDAQALIDKALSAAPAVREPLHQAQLLNAYCNTLGIHQFVQAFVAGARYAEQHHGIGDKK